MHGGVHPREVGAPYWPYCSRGEGLKPGLIGEDLRSALRPCLKPGLKPGLRPGLRPDLKPGLKGKGLIGKKMSSLQPLL